MIQVNFPNIVTIALCGALGYALLIGVQKMMPMLRGATAGAQAGAANA